MCVGGGGGGGGEGDKPLYQMNGAKVSHNHNLQILLSGYLTSIMKSKMYCLRTQPGQEVKG